MLLKDEAIGGTVEELWKAFSSFTGENHRGSRLSDFRNPAQRLKLVGNPKLVPLDEHTHSALHSTVTSGAATSWISFFANSRQKVNAYKKIVVCGVSFQTRHSAAGDSHITFESGDEIWSGSIDKILLPEGVSDVRSVLLSVETFTPLSPEDQENDPYRLWGFAGRELFYDLFLGTPTIITPAQILGHIAKTSVGKVFGIERPCVHTLPLDQVRVCSILRCIRYSTTLSSDRTLRKLVNMKKSNEFMIPVVVRFIKLLGFPRNFFLFKCIPPTPIPTYTHVYIRPPGNPVRRGDAG